MDHSLKGQAFFGQDDKQSFYAFLQVGGTYLCSKVRHTESIAKRTSVKVAANIAEVDAFFGMAAHDKQRLV